MSCYQFRGDDIAIGANRAILAVGRRRYLLDSLTEDELIWLRKLRDSKKVAIEPEVHDRIFHTLLKTGCLMKDNVVDGDTKANSYAILHSKNTVIISRFLANFATPTSLIFMFMSAPVMLTLSFESIALMPLSVVDIFVALCLYAISVVFHELGHAASCFKLTGLVGGIRWVKSSLIFAMRTDVSALALTYQGKRAVNAIAGVCFQLLFASIVMLGGFLGIIRIQTALFATFVIGFFVIYNMIPHYKSDGYWFLSDSFSLKMSADEKYPSGREYSRWGRFVEVITGLRCLAYGFGFVAMIYCFDFKFATSIS